MLPNYNSQEHTCQGSSISEISTLQMMNFVKQKINDGVTNLESIIQLARIKRKFGDFGAQVLGDVDRYQRIIQKRRKIGTGGYNYS